MFLSLAAINIKKFFNLAFNQLNTPASNIYMFRNVNTQKWNFHWVVLEQCTVVLIYESNASIRWWWLRSSNIHRCCVTNDRWNITLISPIRWICVFGTEQIENNYGHFFIDSKIRSNSEVFFTFFLCSVWIFIPPMNVYR